MSAPASPPKYINRGGVMQLNPEYKRWKERQGMIASTVLNPAVALPVVSSLQDHQALSDVVFAGEAVPLAKSTLATLEILQVPEICQAAGMTPETMTDQLTAILCKYEVPMGLANKLFILSEFDSLEFCVDDSGSMNSITDARDAYGRPQTRWQEAQSRLKEMMELLAHVPFQEVVICFLNRPDRAHFTRDDRDPISLLQEMCYQIDSVFAACPRGSTPTLERMEESFAMGRGRSIARYYFGDGLPNGGHYARQRITDLLKHRANPSMNPVTLLSCTGDDEQVEWMKDAEEIAPFCAELDDFGDETREVIRDQGLALPFSKGFYLIAQLVAAMNPDDLDAMDESVPFTKATLNNLLGYECNNDTYRHYFRSFVAAQQRRKVEYVGWMPKASDQLKKRFNWMQHYNAFLAATVAKDIPAVQQFKRELLRSSWGPQAVHTDDHGDRHFHAERRSPACGGFMNLLQVIFGEA